jgi:hypothetical protein
MRFFKVESKIWHNPDFVNLTQSQKLLLMYLTTCPHNNLIGIFPVNIGYIAVDLGADRKQVKSDLVALVKGGFIKYDVSASIVLLKGHLEKNPITNPNQLKAAHKLLESLPKTKLAEELRKVLSIKNKDFAKGLEKGGKAKRNPMKRKQNFNGKGAPCNFDVKSPENPEKISRFIEELYNNNIFTKDWSKILSKSKDKIFTELDNIFTELQNLKKSISLVANLTLGDGSDEDLRGDNHNSEATPQDNKQQQSADTSSATDISAKSDSRSTGTKKKTRSRRIEPSKDAVRLAKLLASLILRNEPSYLHLQPAKREKTVAQYAADIDKLLRIDKSPVDKVETIIRWTQDDDFWQQNILSGRTLRRQFPQLSIRYKAQKRIQEKRRNAAMRDFPEQPNPPYYQLYQDGE